jgi:predicted anti-sigma-YlaC factor YlaD
VLARLDEIPGVSRSRAECSGHYFLVELADGMTGGVAARALEVLGRAAQVLPPEEAEAQQQARRRGEPWVTAEEARSLSFVEGRMLGVRVSAAVSRRVGLTAEQQQALAEAIREEMFAHVELIHAGLAEAGRFFEAWPQIAARAAKRCASWLGPARVVTVASALVDHFRDGAGRP